MGISLEDAERKYRACIAQLDETKNCGRCKYEHVPEGDLPCRICFNALCGFPVNPSQFEVKEATDEG